MNLIQQKHAPETKSFSSNVGDAFDEFKSTFATFQDENDERLVQIEKRVTADVLTDEKVNRINQALSEQKRQLDHLVLKEMRPAIGSDRPFGPAQMEHKTGFEAYIRSGETGNLRQLEAKAMSYGSDPDGGYLVPDETAAEIGRRLALISPIRAIAGVRQVSAAVYKKPFAKTGPAVGWVSETAARPETTSPSLAELQFPTMELYAMPAATPTLLEDAVVDIDAWIADEVETAFAEQEGAAFINGDGINKPKGFLAETTVAESAWSWGNLGYEATGVDGDFPASDASDVLIDTIYALKAGFRQNANWVMNRKTQAEIRKLKDADGNYLWQAPASAGLSASLMGFPLIEAEDMPDIASDAMAIAFGDFRRGYLIVDRTGVRVLRDPYSAKPYVLFYTTKRVGGGVQDFDAIKLLKFGVA